MGGLPDAPDKVWIETTMSGTHEGKFFDFEPTGRSFHRHPNFRYVVP
jgi:hypothetical protein